MSNQEGKNNGVANVIEQFARRIITGNVTDLISLLKLILFSKTLSPVII